MTTVRDLYFFEAGLREGRVPPSGGTTMRSDLARIAAALERIADVADAWHDAMKAPVPVFVRKADPPMPDFTLPESPDDVPVTRPRVYDLSGERPADLADGDHHFFPAGVGR